MTRFTGRYMFVAGLHRTGTSLLAKMIARHPEVRSIANSPAPEDEGCYLQGAIPHTARHGIPGHYATDPAQHHIEQGRYDTREVQARMVSDWDKWFAPGGQWRVEKSPVNLTRMRLYQQLFPMSQFVVILRHPAVMAAALAKWVDAPPAALIDYALDAYDRALTDTEYLHAAMVVRYEDLVVRDHVPALWHFLGLEAHSSDIAMRDGNDDYSDLAPFTAEQEGRATQHGYGPGGSIMPFRAIVRHPLRLVRKHVEASFAAAPANIDGSKR